MPTIEISKKDLEMLLGKKLGADELKDRAMPFVKADIEDMQGDLLKIEIKDTNRPDLLSVEGIVRELQGFYGIKIGLPKFKIKRSNVKVKVDPNLLNIRPRGAYAIAKNVKVTEHLLKQMIQLQEKICETFGRKRKEIAIGLFDYDKVSGNLRYYAANPKTSFIPLDFNEELSLEEILKKHPKGQEYGKLLSGFEKYPLLVDEKGEVLSMPPVINSEYSGKVTIHTRNLFVDVTGFDQKVINTALDIVCAALHDRGAKIESVTVEYKDKQIITPMLEPKKIIVSTELIENIAGLNFKRDEIKKYANMKRMYCRPKKKCFEFKYCSYRADIMHAVDIVEDILIAADYNKLRLEKAQVPSKGAELPLHNYTKTMREACIGLGIQEVLTFTLTSKERQCRNMLLSEENIVELENPLSNEYSIFRRSLMPELLSVLAKNKHREYPQKIFEVGKVALKKRSSNEEFVEEKELVSVIVSHRKADFNEIKAIFDAICCAMGYKSVVEKVEHPSFEKGLCARALIDNKGAIFGVVSKEVMKNFNLDVPVVALEMEL
ncbi:MAG: phenylalanine--tRNA ligase subunit beta [Candidatus Diapherotrites archaeon]|nr:phenylalanine--tRNA ligase subunit beta [Candidatus Diapherotrites archaeon]